LTNRVFGSSLVESLSKQQRSFLSHMSAYDQERSRKRAERLAELKSQRQWRTAEVYLFLLRLVQKKEPGH
jgi:hypothetical protein